MRRGLMCKRIVTKDQRKKEIQVDLNKIKTHKLVWLGRLANSIQSCVSALVF
jgi:hypothetical protein